MLEINDDGIGIDTEQAGRAVQAGHVGLATVRRRVEDAGGTFEIATRPDGGTPLARSRSRKAEWPRAKRPRPFVGRMFYYVLDAPALTCIPSSEDDDS